MINSIISKGGVLNFQNSAFSKIKNEKKFAKAKIVGYNYFKIVKGI